MQNKLDEDLACFLDVFIGCIVHGRISTLIINGDHIELVFSRVQMIPELLVVHPLYILEY